MFPAVLSHPRAAGDVSGERAREFTVPLPTLPGGSFIPTAPGPGSIRLSRRRLLRAGGLAAGLLLADSGQVLAQAAAAGPRVAVIGRTQGGQPIVVYHLGGDRRRVLVVGGQHGSPEANAVDVVDTMLQFFTRYLREIPKNVGLDIVTVANPDGYILGCRQFLSGIDPNRNWPSSDWQPDAYDSLGRLWYGLGGPKPMSEPETRHLATWIQRYRPALVVNYHSAGGFVSTRQDGLAAELGDIYAAASGYPFLGPEYEPFGYPITGAMDAWLAEIGIPDLFVELTTLEDPEANANLAGLLAVLTHLGS